MGNIFNSDFQDFISALNNNKVKYLLVGGYSVILNGYNRTTGDLDIWVRKDAKNYQCILNAFAEFKMPLFDMTKKNFLENESLDVFTFGRTPVSIDLMTSVKGLNFDESFKNSKIHSIENLSVRVVNLNDLLKAKQASARPRDLDDIEKLSGKKRE